MVEAGDDASFFEIDVRAGGVRQVTPPGDFDGHPAVQDLVVRQVHPAEAPFTEDAVDAVPPNPVGWGRATYRLRRDGSVVAFRARCLIRPAVGGMMQFRIGEHPVARSPSSQLGPSQQRRQLGKSGDVAFDFRRDTAARTGTGTRG